MIVVNVVSSIFLLGIVESMATSDAVTLESGLPTQPYVCPGTMLIFRCTTKYSAILDWISKEYINDLIEFPSITSPGTIKYGGVGNYSYGKFTSSTPSEDSRFPVLVSELHITVSRNFSTVFVKCHSRDNGSTEGIKFPVLINNLKVSAGIVVHQDRIVVHFAPITAKEFSHFAIQVRSGEFRQERNITETETEFLLRELTSESSEYFVYVSAVNNCGEHFDGLPLSFTVEDQANRESCLENRVLYAAVGLLSGLVVILFCIIIAFIIGCMARRGEAGASRSSIRNGGNIVCCSHYHDRHHSSTSESQHWDGESGQDTPATELVVKEKESTV